MTIYIRVYMRDAGSCYVVFCDVLETCCLDVQTHCTFKRLQVSCVNLSQVSDGLNGDNFIGQMSFSLTSQSNSSASQCNCSSTVAHSFHSSLIGIHLESVAHIETSWKLISLEQYIGLKAQLHY